MDVFLNTLAVILGLSSSLYFKETWPVKEKMIISFRRF